MPTFPIEYEVDLDHGEVTPQRIRAGARWAIDAGPPPDFGGSDRWWSPEHLFVASVASCYAATFAAAAVRTALHVGTFHCRARGVLAKTEEGIAFTSVHLHVRAHVAVDDVERTKKLLEETKSRCFVANSLRCPVDLSAEVTAS